MGQTGKRREDRAAVLVTTRRSTESQRSGRKRDFKFGNRAQSAEACETQKGLNKLVHLKDGARQGHLHATRLIVEQRAVGADGLTVHSSKPGGGQPDIFARCNVR